MKNDKRQKIIDETQIPDLEKRLAETKTWVSLKTLKISESGEAQKSSSAIAFIASYAMGFIIYFLFSCMVQWLCAVLWRRKKVE